MKAPTGSITLAKHLERYGALPTHSSRFPNDAVQKLNAALIEAGADKRAARGAVEEFCFAIHHYLNAKSTKPARSAKLRRQLHAFAVGSQQLEQAFELLSDAAMHELILTGDGIEGDEDAADAGSSLRNPVARRAIRVIGRYESLLRDVRELRPRVALTLERVQAQTHRGQRKNTGADQLMADAIRAWKNASGRWPSGGRNLDGEAISPLPGLVRELAWRQTDDSPRREALTDKRFRQVLKAEKKAARLDECI